MRFEKEIAQKNLKRKPARTVALVILTAFLAFSIFAGSIIIMSLQNGLKSYESRLGADIVVVPNQATQKGTLESILLQGIPGYFYMDAANIEKIKSTEGVEIASPQFYLASASAGCCSVPVQVIGFDPETDFSIQPWIQRTYSGSIGDHDLVVGSKIEIPTDNKLTFYDTDCNVVAQLEETGTGLDTAVYTNMNTIKEMMNNAKELGFNYFDDTDPDKLVSSVMIKVADGYDKEQVTGDINIHVRRVKATRSQSMISSLSGGLSNVSRMIGILVVVIWVLALVILIIAFFMISNERMKEFAVLRTIGASKKMIGRMLKVESALISLIGAVIGVVVGLLVVFPFSTFIKSRLDLPYLMPNIITVILILVGSIVIAMIAGWLTSSISAGRVSRNETGLILRDGA